MPDKVRVMVAIALTIALAATFASGQHRQIGLLPKGQAIVAAKPFPSVANSAVELGCAAWGEPLAECLAGSENSSKSAGSPKF